MSPKHCSFCMLATESGGAGFEVGRGLGMLRLVDESVSASIQEQQQQQRGVAVASS